MEIFLYNKKLAVIISNLLLAVTNCCCRLWGLLSLVDSHSTFYYYMFLLDTHLLFISRYLLTVYAFQQFMFFLIDFSSLYTQAMWFPIRFSNSIRSSHALLAKVYIVSSSIFHETCYSCYYCPYIARILPRIYPNILLEYCSNIANLLLE